jgi:hypothetical protein
MGLNEYRRCAGPSQHLPEQNTFEVVEYMFVEPLGSYELLSLNSLNLFCQEVWTLQSPEMSTKRDTSYSEVVFDTSCLLISCTEALAGYSVCLRIARLLGPSSLCLHPDMQ